MMTSDKRANNIALTQNLADAGYDSEEIERFLEMNRQGNKCGQMRLLTEHRKQLLDDVHACEKKISCLDYLAYKIRTDD